MKTTKILVAITFLIVWQNAHGQGFVNLDFENATVTPVPGNPNHIVASDAIPGWTAYLGGNPQTSIGYDTVSLGGAAVFLEDANAPSGGGPLPIQGNYSMLLQGSTASTPTAASIGQIGQIPANSLSLIFWGYSSDVSFGGQNLSLVVLGSTPNYNIYGADISAFAGQTGQLLFTAQSGSEDIIDNIQFSPSAVPEPSEFALSVLGALLLGFRRWKNSLH
jgi:hypothetical protein